MRFMHLKLENWRNFTNVDVPLRERAFLAGPNASGKSNFLDVFRFLRDVSSPGFQGAVLSRGGVSRIRSLAARRASDVTIEVALGHDSDADWRYRLTLNQDAQRRPQVRIEEVWKGPDIVLQRPDKEDRKDPQRLFQTNLEQVIANKAFRPISEFFGSTRYYHIVPQLVRDPGRSVGRSADPFGGDFLEQIAGTPAKTRDARLRRITQALKVAVPQLGELKLEKDEAGRPHLLGNYQHWRPHGAWQTEADFSDGTLRLMGLLWALLDGDGPILLEEPELSLHPEVIRHIPQMIARMQRKIPRQVLLSTHSGDLLRDKGIAEDEVILFTPGAEGTKVERGDSIEEVGRLLQAGLSVSEVVMARTQPPEASNLTLFGK